MKIVVLVVVAVFAAGALLNAIVGGPSEAELRDHGYVSCDQWTGRYVDADAECIEGGDLVRFSER